MTARMAAGDPFEPPAGPATTLGTAKSPRERPNVGNPKRPKRKAKAPRGQVMSAEAMAEWRERRNLSRAALAEMLDMTVSSIQRFERGARFDKDRPSDPVLIPKLVRLALAALAMGILDYNGIAPIGPPVVFPAGDGNG